MTDCEEKEEEKKEESKDGDEPKIDHEWEQLNKNKPLWMHNPRMSPYDEARIVQGDPAIDPGASS